MKTKILCFICASSLCNVALASSPFMVRSNSVESSNTTAVTQTNSGKSTTIAQSLMQMRQCDETSHMGQPLDKSRAPSSPIVRQDTPIQ